MSNKLTYEELERRVQLLEHNELERKKTDEELAEIFAMSLDIICIADMKTATFIRVNPAFKNTLGYSENDLLEKPFYDFIHPDDINATRTVIEQQLQKGVKVINFENRYRCKDGSYRWLSWVSHPNKEKSVTFAVARDITAWKQNEEALKKYRDELEYRVKDRTAEVEKVNDRLVTSEAKFRALFDSTPIPLGYVGNTGTVIDINAKFTQVFGYTRTDIPTFDDWSKRAYPEPAYRRWVTAKRETALKNSRDEGVDIGPIECQLTCKSGEVKQVFTSYTALQESFLVAFVDITDLRRAEEAERRSNTLYREITNQSGEGISIADFEGNYVSVNPAFCTMTGYSEARLLGMKVKDLVPSEEKMSLFPKVVRGEQGRREAKLVKKDGSHFVAEIHAYPLDLKNQRLVLGNVRDITARVQADEQIKASLKEKEVLLREIHHRVKNNLAVIISLLNLQSYQFQDDRIAAALQDNRDRVKSMALIHETLYLSENVAEISLKEYAPNLGDRLLQAMKGKSGQVRIVYEIEDIRLDIDHAIACGLILNELLTNALKYAFPEGNGEVSVAVHHTETDEIELVVKDNGAGLPKGLDTGNLKTLGLEIVSTLTENQLEGNLNIRNENGACFTIRWPLSTDGGEKE